MNSILVIIALVVFGTYYVDQVGFKFRDPPALSTQVLAFKACAMLG